MNVVRNLNIAIEVIPHGQPMIIGEFHYFDQILNQHEGVEQLIGTTAELLDMEVSPPTFLFLKNLGDNTITVDSTNTMTNFPQSIIPGTQIFLLPQTGSIWAKAATAPCKLWILAAN